MKCLLFNLGPNAQKAEFSIFYELLYTDIDPAKRREIDPIDDVSKIDISNAVQFNDLYRKYKHNMGVVFFWLRIAVFPIETVVFPSRMAANSWDITDSYRTIGFSGTKGNRILLPLLVEQVDIDDSLKATNGKMLHYISRKFLYENINVDDAVSVEAFLQRLNYEASNNIGFNVLHQAIKKKADVLIDTGALLTGFSNREYAINALKLMILYNHQGSLDKWLLN